MTRLTILRGVSGSGKSTWAEAQAGNPVIVSRDKMRVAYFGSDGQDYYKVDKAVLRKREDYITKIEHAAVAEALTSGLNVISDNTNIRPKYMTPIANIGFKAGAHVEVKTFDVKLETAIKRNQHRFDMGGRYVPEAVIRDQHSGLQGTLKYELVAPEPVKPYVPDTSLPPAFLVDIDGTLAHMGDKRGPFDWDKVDLDDVDDIVADIVASLGASTYYKVIVMSGRDSAAEEKTIQWLEDNGILYDELFMRAKRDMRKDSIVKAELFDEHIRDRYNVRFVLDDRDQVVDMWREMGIKCLQVAPGAF